MYQTNILITYYYTQPPKPFAISILGIDCHAKCIVATAIHCAIIFDNDCVDMIINCYY